MIPRGTEEKPLYAKVKQEPGHLFMVTVDAGWMSTVLCSDMYEHVADWLVEQLQGKPFPVS